MWDVLDRETGEVIFNNWPGTLAEVFFNTTFDVAYNRETKEVIYRV